LENKNRILAECVDKMKSETKNIVNQNSELLNNIREINDQL